MNARPVIAVDPLQRRANEIAAADHAQDVNEGRTDTDALVARSDADALDALTRALDR